MVPASHFKNTQRPLRQDRVAYLYPGKNIALKGNISQLFYISPSFYFIGKNQETLTVFFPPIGA